jgi:hypothetical protein
LFYFFQLPFIPISTIIATPPGQVNPVCPSEMNKNIHRKPGSAWQAIVRSKGSPGNSKLSRKKALATLKV